MSTTTSDPTFINRRTCSRTRPMRLLCLGLSRTGTESLRTALRQLGYADVYHGFSAYAENPPDLYLWLEALQAKYENKGRPFAHSDWDQLLGHCEAVTDLPAAMFAEELMDAYPDAQIMLTVRDVEEWEKSLLGTFEEYVRNRPFGVNVLRYFDPLYFANEETSVAVLKYGFDGDFTRNGRRFFEEHNERVRRLARERERECLVFKVAEGWKPLCDYLKLPVPDGPFPSGNITPEFNRKIMATRNMVYEPAFWNCMKEMRELREQWAGEGCIGKAFLEKEKEMMGENGGCPFCGASH